MSTVRVMYWKEIPVQIEATDGKTKVSKPLDDRFQQGGDAISMFDGSSGTDEYLDAWQWVHYCDCLLYTSPSPRDATLSRMP